MKKSNNSFFEEDESKDQETKTAVKSTKETCVTSNVGEYYGKNVIYKYKDGSLCTVVYDAKDSNYITRQMG
jgi:spermidine/putrescine-binding protein